eukprot:3416222-Rhodomonas_salina.3
MDILPSSPSSPLPPFPCILILFQFIQLGQWTSYPPPARDQKEQDGPPTPTPTGREIFVLPLSVEKENTVLRIRHALSSTDTAS